MSYIQKRFKRGTTQIKARIMCMTSFGISGAEALDPTTRVFVCLFVCYYGYLYAEFPANMYCCKPANILNEPKRCATLTRFTVI
jgi:hypothetical protein